jgi:hypothetical protein
VYWTKGGISPIEYPGGCRGVLLLFLDLLLDGLDGREVMLNGEGTWESLHVSTSSHGGSVGYMYCPGVLYRV